MPQDFDGKIRQQDLNFILTKLTNLYNTYRQPNVVEEIDPAYQPPASSVSINDKIVIGDLTTLHTHYQTKIGNGANAALWSAGGPAQYKVILDDEFEQLYSAIEQINFISQQPCYVCDLDVCECDVSAFEWTGCTCEEACDSGYSCDCDDSCDGYTCGCYDTCYGSYVPPPESGECTCNFGCDSYSSCTCNSTCDSGYSCSCFSSCDPDSCTCEFSYYTCNQCYGSNYVCSVSY